MWRGMILPEVEEQLESSRISGPAALRNPLASFPPPSDQSVLPEKEEKKREKKEEEET